MQPERFQHRRSSGKQLTYDVSVWPDHYAISLNGKMLKQCVEESESVPTVTVNVSILSDARTGLVPSLKPGGCGPWRPAA